MVYVWVGNVSILCVPFRLESITVPPTYLAPAKAEVVGRLEWENPVSRKGTRLGKQADIILAEQVRLAY